MLAAYLVEAWRYEHTFSIYLTATKMPSASKNSRSSPKSALFSSRQVRQVSTISAYLVPIRLGRMSLARDTRWSLIEKGFLHSGLSKVRPRAGDGEGFFPSWS